ncbi:hypothetical protein Mal15_00760 [Stieleria maiorica]|uniref:Uncharacterized protein n=1 Tax=Stieleria maiorica TaxID=2795974 RepID=A0A5B9M7N5_9BACT|nr:hypothetical protein [Stieleria maiorica]QEF96050.1 hypothetical protein Mal15_00760 [Stieleria maiorica]
MNDKTKARPVSVDDLQDLYGELRGSRSAPAIMDARAHFLERQWADSHTKLNEAYEKYRESRQRILRQDPEKEVDAKAKDRDRQIRRLKRKQDKAREIIEKFELYLPQIERLAEKEREKEERKAAEVEAAVAEAEASESDTADAVTTQPATSEDQQGPSGADDRQTITKDSVEEAFLKQFSELIGDRQLDFISNRYDFRPLETPEDVQADAVYLLRKGDRCLMVHAEVVAGSADSDEGIKLLCVDIAKAKNRVELSPKAMVRLSRKRKLVLLLAKG